MYLFVILKEIEQLPYFHTLVRFFAFKYISIKTRFSKLYLVGKEKYILKSIIFFKKKEN